MFVRDESIKYGSHILDLLHTIQPTPGDGAAPDSGEHTRKAEKPEEETADDDGADEVPDSD